MSVEILYVGGIDESRMKTVVQTFSLEFSMQYCNRWNQSQKKWYCVHVFDTDNEVTSSSSFEFLCNVKTIYILFLLAGVARILAIEGGISDPIILQVIAHSLCLL